MNEIFKPILPKPARRLEALKMMTPEVLSEADVIDWDEYRRIDPTRRISPHGFSYQSRFSGKPDYK
jgi:hypothetical protein